MADGWASGAATIPQEIWHEAATRKWFISSRMRQFRSRRYRSFLFRFAVKPGRRRLRPGPAARSGLAALNSGKLPWFRSGFPRRVLGHPEPAVPRPGAFRWCGSAMSAPRVLAIGCSRLSSPGSELKSRSLGRRTHSPGAVYPSFLWLSTRVEKTQNQSAKVRKNFSYLESGV